MYYQMFLHLHTKDTGWGGKVRTYASMGQSHLPYHLATPQYKLRKYYTQKKEIFQPHFKN